MIGRKRRFKIKCQANKQLEQISEQSSDSIKSQQLQLNMDDFLKIKGNPHKRTRGRGHNSILSKLTVNFIRLIKTYQNYTIDLNDACKILNVQKRRIYDITNVMEGVGYLQKVHKNVVRWIGSTPDPTLQKDMKYLTEQIEYYKNKEREFDEAITQWTDKLNNDFTSEPQLNYLIQEDLEKFYEQQLQEDQNGMFIISAPVKSLLLLSPQDEKKKTTFAVVSQKPINVYDCKIKDVLRRKKILSKQQVKKQTAALKENVNDLIKRQLYKKMGENLVNQQKNISAEKIEIESYQKKVEQVSQTDLEKNRRRNNTQYQFAKEYADISLKIDMSIKQEQISQDKHPSTKKKEQKPNIQVFDVIKIEDQ